MSEETDEWDRMPASKKRSLAMAALENPAVRWVLGESERAHIEGSLGAGTIEAREEARQRYRAVMALRNQLKALAREPRVSK